jgi:cell division protein FtsI/penicillin-binding protein 2
MQRLRLIFIFLVIFALILIVRLYYLQVIHGQNYADRADRQYVLPNNHLFDRGSIYLKNKDESLMSAASLQTGYIISLNPKKVKDSTEVFNSLRELIPLEVDSFYAKANKNSQYEKLADHVSEDLMKKIEVLKLPGVEIQKERWRFYPGESLASRTLGFVAFDEDSNVVGRYGLEKYYEDILSRKSNAINVNFFAEIFSNIRQTLDPDDQAEGDIITSIEPVVQATLEKELESVMQKYSSKLTGGIVVDPMTGEIYAMAVNPDFNLNEFSEVSNISVYNNPLVEGIYEMGSIIKPLTIAAGLDMGAITPDTTYIDKGSLTLNGHTIYNVDRNARGKTTMQDILDHSMNTGVSYIVSRMGNKNFADYFKAYGLAEETGIDLPGENYGRLQNLESPRDIEYATASFGQGISLTPIATVRALSALANGGKLITPHIVSRINYKTGLHNNISYVDQARQVLKKETSEEISRMLVGVVDKALAGGSVKLPHYSVAAKTGTAQIAMPGGGYYNDRFLHSLFGYFPAYEPRFLIFLYTTEPQNITFASQTLTEPFMDMVKFLINYYNITPDR